MIRFPFSQTLTKFPTQQMTRSMHNDHFNTRRLRFPLEANARESIPGLLARGVREHVLLHTRPILSAAGVNLKHLGHAQLATIEELKRLAYVTRSSHEWLAKCAGEKRPGLLPGSLTVDVKFGERLVPFAYLEVNRRRISPLSLKTADFHRLDWMNLLLPYCPESLEQLIDGCGRCGAKLGWHYARGIGTCEYCDLEVSPADSPPLADHLAKDYRLFAKLSSFDGSDVSEALATLPVELRSIEPADLVRLVLLVGGLKSGLMDQTTCRKKVTTLAPEDLAKVVSTGVSILRSWPIGFQNWVEAEANRLRENTIALKQFRARLRRLAMRGRETAKVSELVTNALPELRQHPVHGFAKFERHYLRSDVHRILGVTANEIDLLREIIGEAYQRSATTTHFQKGQFDADYIDKLVPAFRASTAFNSCASHFKLPIYAVAQCCRPNLLEHRDCTVLAKIRSGEYICSGSSAVLTEHLFNHRQKIARPAQTVSLSVAAKRIGGRLKPWGSIFESLRSGNMPYWIEGKDLTLRTVYVWPVDICQFQNIVDLTFDDGALLTNFIVSQADAAEILNMPSAQLAREATALGIHFRKSGRGFAASLPEVLFAASSVAWSAEIAWHLGTRYRDVEEMLQHRNISRLRSGWDRRQLISAEILPEIP
jgi:hypothetical protein